MNRSNIMLNGDNIEIITKVKGFMPFVKIVCDSEEHAEHIKQQILENQEIVQRFSSEDIWNLIHLIQESKNNWFPSYKIELENKLKSILENNA